MTRKILLFLFLGWCVALFALAFTILLLSDSVVLNIILQWAIPAMLIVTFIYFIAIAVRHNLRTANHFPGFNGHLPMHTAIEVIGKWGVRW